MALVILFQITTVLLYATRSAGAISCYICDYTAADTCEYESEYRLVDCSEFWADSRYCLTFNGTRKSVARDTDKVTISTGLHRACQREADVEIYGLYDVEPGCRTLHVLNQNSSLYSNFFYDGSLCLCEEDGCNSGSKMFGGYLSNFIWSTALLAYLSAFARL
ncbi:uncharacterized protein LOC129584807 [Paramacrobiotus metropolitanus]|uniref:uncharacterized protein LOC129584807 n=1 Tax=Paramacrobiotus metropolitanus TaxID=2943436 RepID=UPI002445E29E|nr:uncharacterized protein LOC129584807 [Paramacrobiotus metropolitanus]